MKQNCYYCRTIIKTIAHLASSQCHSIGSSPPGAYGLDKYNTEWCRRPIMGVTKHIFSVFVIFTFFRFIKISVTCWISRSYLTGVATAELWRHLSNPNVIELIQQLLSQMRKFPQTEMQVMPLIYIVLCRYPRISDHKGWKSRFHSRKMGMEFSRKKESPFNILPERN